MCPGSRPCAKVAKNVQTKLKLPGLEDQAEALSVQDVMFSIGPEEPFIRICSQSVPSMGWIFCPRLRILPLMYKSSSIDSSELFAPGPSKVAVRFGAALMLKFRLYVLGNA